MRASLAKGTLISTLIALAFSSGAAADYAASYGRHLVRGIRQARESRDLARKANATKRTLAVVTVDNESRDPEAADLATRAVVAHLKARGWRVLDPEITMKKVANEGFASLNSRRRLQYLSRILDAGTLVRIVVRKFTVSSLRREYEELLHTGHFTCPDNEFAEDHLRLSAFGASANDVVWCREDRQYEEYRYQEGKTNRDRILKGLLDRNVANLLAGF